MSCWRIYWQMNTKAYYKYFLISIYYFSLMNNLLLIICLLLSFTRPRYPYYTLDIVALFIYSIKHFFIVIIIYHVYVLWMSCRFGLFIYLIFLKPFSPTPNNPLHPFLSLPWLPSLFPLFFTSFLHIIMLFWMKIFFLFIFGTPN